MTRSNGISRLIENYPRVPCFALRRNITIYVDDVPLSGDDESFSWGMTKCASIEKTFLLADRKESVGKELKRTLGDSHHLQHSCQDSRIKDFLLHW